MIIKINGFAWKVLFVERQDIDGSLGLTSFRTLKISIAHDVAKDTVLSTITHELIHAIISSYGFVPDFTEEQVCEFVAMNLSTINELSMKVYLEYKRKYNIK